MERRAIDWIFCLVLLLVTIAVPVQGEVVLVRSGSGAGHPGAPDTAVSMLVGPAGGGFSGPFTEQDFADAVSGPHAIVTTTNPAWIASLTEDSTARWINNDGLSGNGRTVLYAVPFSLSQAAAIATLDLHYAVDDRLGDLNVGRPGVYINGAPVPGTIGIGDFLSDHFLLSSVQTPLRAGLNHLFLYDFNGGSDAGIVFTATITTQQLPVAQTLRSGSGGGAPGSFDPIVTMLVSPGGGGFPNPFSPQDFSDAANGPSAFVTSRNPNWISSLPSDPNAQWINNDGVAVNGQSVLYAARFVYEGPPESGRLDLYYAVDDRLGDPSLNRPGVYMNGTVLSGASGVGDFWSEYTFTADLDTLLREGANYLYLYNWDGGADAGIIFSATITTTGQPTGVSSPATSATSWGAVKRLFR
ncbi:MAG: hypothetical protein ACKVU1_02795 [bacterium]